MSHQEEIHGDNDQSFLKSTASFRLSRRDFVLLAGLSSLKVIARSYSDKENLGWLMDVMESKPTPEWIVNLPKYDINPPKTAAQPQLYGLAINTPFLYRASREDQEQILNLLYKVDPDTDEKKLWPQRARILVDDSLQPGIRTSDGSSFGYDDNVLKQIANFAHLLEERGIGCEIDAFDFFTMGNSQYQQSYVYCQSDVSSIYNASKDKAGYRNFFVSPESNVRYLERLRHIFNVLTQKHGVTNIVVASPGNEPNPKYISDDQVEGQEILTRWHQEAIDAIHSVSPHTAVVASVVEPWNINANQLTGLAATTVHAHLANIEMQRLSNYRNNVFVQETGFPERFASCFPQGTFGFDVPQNIKDFLCRKYIETLVDALVDVHPGDSHYKQSITPYVTGISGWKADIYNDWYHFFPQKFPDTYALLYYLDTWLFQRTKEKLLS